MIITKSESLQARLAKTKDALQEELKTSKNDLTVKIEETDKFFNEQVEILQASIERNKVTAKEQLQRAKDDFHKSLKSESNDIKAVIGRTRDEIKEQGEQEK